MSWIRQWIFIASLFPLSAFAIGETKAVAVENNGRAIDVTLANEVADTHMPISMGFGTNNTGVSKIVLTVWSPGFDSTGTSNWTARTVYVSQVLRQPNANQTLTNLSQSGSDTIVCLSLSDYIYFGDVVSNYVAQSNWYSNNVAAWTTNVIANGSTLEYGNAIANWSWPGWQRWTNTTERLRAVGFHWSGTKGRPLACMKLMVADDSAHSVTNTVTDMAIDRTLPDLIPTGEYYADFTLSAFTALDQLRCDFAAYPRIGVATNVFNTKDNKFTGVNMMQFPSSQTNICDPNQAESQFIAVVDPSIASETGARATNVPPAQVNSAHYFKTLTVAWNAIAASNNLYAAPIHNTASGGRVYIRTTTTTDFVWTSGTLSAGALALSRCWNETCTYPGDTQARLTNRLNDRNVGHRVKFQNISIATATATVPFNAIGAMWFNQCNFNTISTAWIQLVTNSYVTHGTVTTNANGFGGGTTYWPVDLLRGTTLAGLGSGVPSVNYYVMMGNVHADTNAGINIVIQDANATANAQQGQGDFTILYNNYFGGLAGNPGFRFGYNNGITNGAVLEQNVFEYVGSPASTSNSLASFNSSGAFFSTNILIGQNICVGERIADILSNSGDSASVPVNRINSHFRNNLFDISGFKDDTTGGGTASGTRTNNWGAMWQVGSSGNFFIEPREDPNSIASFPPDFAGLSSHCRGLNQTNIVNYPQYINRLAYAGDLQLMSGGGNYRVTSTSPIQGFMLDYLIPFDLEGNARGLLDPPGAYASASPRKGGGFFAQ